MGADSWQDVVAQVNQDIKTVQNDIETSRKVIRDEQKKLKNELAALKNEVSQKEKTVQELKQEFEELLQNEETLQKDLAVEEEEIQTLENSLRTVAKDVNDIIDSSLITPENPSRHELIAPLLELSRFPGMDDIENLAKVLFEETEAGGEIQKQNGIFINAQGTEVSGTILRVGKFTACYKSGDQVGYLRFDRNLNKMAVIPGKPPRKIRRAIEKYISGQSDHLPLDLTGGIIAEQADQNHKIREWLDSCLAHSPDCCCCNNSVPGTDFFPGTYSDKNRQNHGQPERSCVKRELERRQRTVRQKYQDSHL
ncbi:MAG: DUF3450 family protein [Desulfobacterales bacterium]|nr:DUF3450 family protein [Desulfobacterales bacterium]